MKYTIDDAVFILGRMEGELVEIRKLSQRVAALEQWLNWLKGGWAILAGAFAFCFKLAVGK
jgi:hypothetical protein